MNVIKRDKARAQPTIATTVPGALRLCMPSLWNGLRVPLWGDRQRLHRGSPSQPDSRHRVHQGQLSAGHQGL